MTKLISNFARLIPEYDPQKGHRVAMTNSTWPLGKYPFGLPVVYMEGIFEKENFFSADGSTLTMVHDTVITRFTQRHRPEWKGIDQNGEEVWIDEDTMRSEEYWRKLCEDEEYSFLDYRRAFYFDVEEINLIRCEKRKYKVTLESTSKMDPSELFDYVDYADPNMIKRTASIEMSRARRRARGR